MGAEAVYEPHKCLCVDRTGTGRRPHLTDACRRDQMRRKAPATRIAEGGLSAAERVARYSRFPDLKPPDAASALTADGALSPVLCRSRAGAA